MTFNREIKREIKRPLNRVYADQRGSQRRRAASHLPESTPGSVGIGTIARPRGVTWLPRLHRASPSTSLDKVQEFIHLLCNGFYFILAKTICQSVFEKYFLLFLYQFYGVSTGLNPYTNFPSASAN